MLSQALYKELILERQKRKKKKKRHTHTKKKIMPGGEERSKSKSEFLQTEYLSC